MKDFISFSKLGSFGRLGNQLFQIAATIAAAERFDRQAVFPLWKYAYAFQGPFDQSLDLDRIKYVYAEPFFSYAAIPDLPNLDLKGYFQSWRYFDHCRELIRQRLRFAADLLPERWPGLSDTWAIHVRRGDYIKLAHYHVNLNMDYYLEAMNLARNFGATSFLIFSDDLQWCRENFSQGVDFVEGLDEVQSLCLMSKCGNHIIANSSYSWWGSWLSENPQQKIIAPRMWFTIQTDTEDLYLPKWHRL